MALLRDTLGAPRPRLSLDRRDAVALTFDDGPDPDFTPPILERLRTTGAVATFFLVGDRVAAHPDLARRIAAEGHAVGTHSWSHPDPGATRPWTLAADYRRGRKAAEAALGRTIRLFRPPRGHVDRAGVAAMAAVRLRPWLWTDDTEDWKAESTVDDILERLRGVEGGAVVLAHDSLHGGDPAGRDRGATVDAIGPICDLVRDRRLHFVTLPD